MIQPHPYYPRAHQTRVLIIQGIVHPGPLKKNFPPKPKGAVFFLFFTILE
jgi:hypothetical protein